MKVIKKMLIWTFAVLTGLYIVVCTLLYVFQERLIFFPTKLPQDYTFQFLSDFAEVYIPTQDGIKLHGLLFNAERSKGLIFYLHGNGGAVDSWGEMADIYTSLGYDLFVLDYRGYGKSEGKIVNEKQVYQDAQAAYDIMKKIYQEHEIIVVGYSIGTGSASMLASVNDPKMLILQAPYYSLPDLVNKIYPPVIPASLLLKYHFPNFKHLQTVKAPVIIFHGKEDALIPYTCSLRLQQYLKSSDKVYIIDGLGHGGMNEHEEYKGKLRELLVKISVDE